MDEPDTPSCHSSGPPGMWVHGRAWYPLLPFEWPPGHPKHDYVCCVTTYLCAKYDIDGLSNFWITDVSVFSQSEALICSVGASLDSDSDSKFTTNWVSPSPSPMILYTRVRTQTLPLWTQTRTRTRPRWTRTHSESSEKCRPTRQS